MFSSSELRYPLEMGLDMSSDPFSSRFHFISHRASSSTYLLDSAGILKTHSWPLFRQYLQEVSPGSLIHCAVMLVSWRLNGLNVHLGRLTLVRRPRQAEQAVVARA